MSYFTSDGENIPRPRAFFDTRPPLPGFIGGNRRGARDDIEFGLSLSQATACSMITRRALWARLSEQTAQATHSQGQPPIVFGNIAARIASLRPAKAERDPLRLRNAGLAGLIHDND